MHFSTVGDLARATSTFVLQRNDLARRQPPSAVMSRRALASLLRSATASAAEAAEDDAVGGTDAGADEHGDGQFGHHRHVQGDAVAGLDALALEHVGELANLAMQILVAEHPGVARLRPPR